MTVRPLVLWPDARLQTVCAPIEPAGAHGLIRDLFDTMYAAKGRGLAAPQIGVMARVFVVDVTWKEGPPTPLAFLNPELRGVSGEQVEMQEQCLSIPDLPMSVTRAAEIYLGWTAPDSTAQDAWFDGATARCILHELDHLEGRVILDHQSATDRARLEAVYAG